MKKILLIAALACTIGAKAQQKDIFYDVPLKSQYQGETSKAVSIKNGLTTIYTKFSGHQVEVTAIKGSSGAMLLALDPPEPQLLEVAFCDLNSDGVKDVVVAYMAGPADLKFNVYDGKSFKQIGQGHGAEHLRFFKNQLAVVFEHESGEQDDVYTVKGGQLVVVGEN